MMRRLWLACLLLPSLACATEVRVTVTGLTSDRGLLRVAVCPESVFLKDDCPYRTKVPAHRGTMVVILPGVPPGAYAVLAHHDTDGNGEIRRSLLGIPEEGIGFSNNPSLFHAPRFAESAIRVGTTLVDVDIALKFEP